MLVTSMGAYSGNDGQHTTIYGMESDGINYINPKSHSIIINEDGSLNLNLLFEDNQKYSFNIDLYNVENDISYNDRISGLQNDESGDQLLLHFSIEFEAFATFLQSYSSELAGRNVIRIAFYDNGIAHFSEYELNQADVELILNNALIVDSYDEDSSKQLSNCETWFMRVIDTGEAVESNDYLDNSEMASFAVTSQDRDYFAENVVGVYNFKTLGASYRNSVTYDGNLYGWYKDTINWPSTSENCYTECIIYKFTATNVNGDSNMELEIERNDKYVYFVDEHAPVDGKNMVLVANRDTGFYVMKDIFLTQSMSKNSDFFMSSVGAASIESGTNVVGDCVNVGIGYIPIVSDIFTFADLFKKLADDNDIAVNSDHQFNMSREWENVYNATTSDAVNRSTVMKFNYILKNQEIVEMKNSVRESSNSTNHKIQYNCQFGMYKNTLFDKYIRTHNISKTIG